MTQSSIRRVALALIVAVVTASGGAFAAKGKDPSPPATKPVEAKDRLTKGSLWTGTFSPDDRRADVKTSACRLKITAVDGDTFEAVLRVNNGRKGRAIKLRGQTRGNEVRMKPTAVVDGEWGSQILRRIFIGGFDGDSLTFRAPPEGNEDDGTQSPKLSLTKSDKSADD